MARPLKVFAYTLSCSSEESKLLGQRSHIRQVKAIVATTTKKEAVEKFGITQSEARGYMSETRNAASIAKATSKPGQVFAYGINDYSEDKKYIEIARRPHVPIPRPKRPSYEEMMATREENRKKREARRLTKEELEYIAEMFGGSNYPVALSIAEKARLMLEDMAD